MNVLRVVSKADGSTICLWTCYWCKRQYLLHGSREHYHHTTVDRNCCRSCFDHPLSNYRRIYGPAADPESVVVEVTRARRG